MQNVNELSMYADVARASARSSYLTKDEEYLLACARAGDAGAFGSLVMPHRDTILRLTQRILRNREDAEDAVQSAFLDALRHLDGFEGRSRFSSWLTSIALNAAFMKLRASRRRSETSLDEIFERETGTGFQLPEARPNPEQECSAREVRTLLNKALGRLRPIYAEVLDIRDVQDISAREAARILDVPVGTVKARLHRARTQLTRHVRSMLARRRRAAAVKGGRSGGFQSSEALGRVN